MSATAKVTYISLSADDPALDAAFETAIAKVRGALGGSHPLHVAGQTRSSETAIERRSPSRCAIKNPAMQQRISPNELTTVSPL